MNPPKKTTMSENTIFKGKLSSLKCESSSAIFWLVKIDIPLFTFPVRLKGVRFCHIYKSRVVLVW